MPRATWKGRLEVFIEATFGSAYQCEKETKKRVTQAALSDWRADRQETIRSDSLERLAEATGLSPSWLLLGKGPRHVRDLEGRGEIAQSWKAAVLHAITEQIRAKHGGHSHYTAARTADDIVSDLPSFDHVVREVALKAVAAWEQERLSPLEQQAEALRASLIERIEQHPESSGAERDNLVELEVQLARARRNGSPLLLLDSPIDERLLLALGPQRKIRRITHDIVHGTLTDRDGRTYEGPVEFRITLDPKPITGLGD